MLKSNLFCATTPSPYLDEGGDLYDSCLNGSCKSEGGFWGEFFIIKFANASFLFSSLGLSPDRPIPPIPLIFIAGLLLYCRSVRGQTGVTSFVIVPT